MSSLIRNNRESATGQPPDTLKTIPAKLTIDTALQSSTIERSP
jgi:hypothetical protein